MQRQSSPLINSFLSFHATLFFFSDLPSNTSFPEGFNKTNNVVIDMPSMALDFTFRGRSLETLSMILQLLNVDQQKASC